MFGHAGGLIPIVLNASCTSALYVSEKLISRVWYIPAAHVSNSCMNAATCALATPLQIELSARTALPSAVSCAGTAYLMIGTLIGAGAKIGLLPPPGCVFRPS